jgi:hypothetical protein
MYSPGVSTLPASANLFFHVLPPADPVHLFRRIKPHADAAELVGDRAGAVPGPGEARIVGDAFGANLPALAHLHDRLARDRRGPAYTHVQVVRSVRGELVHNTSESRGYIRRARRLRFL